MHVAERTPLILRAVWRRRRQSPDGKTKLGLLGANIQLLLVPCMTRPCVSAVRRVGAPLGLLATFVPSWAWRLGFPSHDELRLAISTPLPRTPLTPLVGNTQGDDGPSQGGGIDQVVAWAVDIHPLAWSNGLLY